jgi:6-phosphogluconate dehydrogenase (decarboxylating)
MWGTSKKSTIPLPLLSNSITKSSGIFSGEDTVIDHPVSLNWDSTEYSDVMKLRDVESVFCGASGTAFVTNDGRCFVVGSNKNGELG